MNTPRRRSNALADAAADVNPLGQGALRVAADPNKMVTVTIEKSYTLTLDDGREVKYQAGTDEMPLSHAKHWWSKQHGVELYVTPRSSPEQLKLAAHLAAQPSTPPSGDPDKVAAAQRQGIAELTALNPLQVNGPVDLLPADMN